MIFSCIFIFYIFSSSSLIKSKFESYISFINVGQGDSILIHDKNINVLIDTGGSMYMDIGGEVLIPYLNKKGINSLDYVFLTHDDIDHNGAFPLLKEKLEVKNYILGSDFYKISIKNHTFYNLNHYSIHDLNNDDSSVIKFKFYNKTYLFTGDISINIEKKLTLYEDVDADILKVAHHGSKTSSCIEFLKKVSPESAVISVGKNNYYNHPNIEVVNRLYSLNIKILRTDEIGTITLYPFDFDFDLNCILYLDKKRSNK